MKLSATCRNWFITLALVIVASVSFCFMGCQEAPVQQVPSEIVNELVPVPDESSEMKLTAPIGLIAQLYSYLGSSNTVTLADANEVVIGEIKINIPAGANFTYTFSNTGGVIVFNSPRPVITCKAWKFTVHPILEKFIITSDTSGVAQVRDSLGFPHTKVIDFTPEAQSEPAPPVQVKPTLYAWSTTTCAPCITAKKDLAETKLPLPFEVVWDPKGVEVPTDLPFPNFKWHESAESPLAKGKFWRTSGWTSVAHLIAEFKAHRT